MQKNVDFKKKELIVGIRPENIQVCFDNNHHWRSKAFVVEKLGSSTFIYLDSQIEPVVVECDGDISVKTGDIINVKFNFEKIILFNK